MDSDLWHACAGPLVRLPPVNSVVYYFPQGHAEFADSPPEFPGPTIPHAIRCRLTAVNLSADPKTDSVYATMSLSPIPNGFGDLTDNAGEDYSAPEPPCSKVLTQSDANNGGGFSVPKACADKVFPELDYAADPPVQTIAPRDVHGTEWKFRHIFRGTPRRHLLTSGWSTFVNSKSLVSGDCIFFLKLSGGGMGVGVRRGRRVRGIRVPAEDVLKATRAGMEGKEFEVVYEPGVAAEFVVRAEKVDRLLRMSSVFGFGAKVMVDFEDSVDPTLKKPFLGTIFSFQPIDPVFFPSSPWRMITVVWDEYDMLKNVDDQSQNNMSLVNPWSISFQPSMIPIPAFPNQKLINYNHKFKDEHNSNTWPITRPSEAKESGPITGSSDTTTEEFSYKKDEENEVDKITTQMSVKEVGIDFFNSQKEFKLFGVVLNSSTPSPPSPPKIEDAKSDVPFIRCVFPKKKKKKTKALNSIGSILKGIKARKQKMRYDALDTRLTLS